MSGHTIHLAELVDREIVYVDKVEAPHTVRMYSRIGRPASPYASGVGKAVLAFLEPHARTLGRNRMGIYDDLGVRRVVNNEAGQPVPRVHVEVDAASAKAPAASVIADLDAATRPSRCRPTHAAASPRASC